MRGRKCRTTMADDSAERPLDQVNRQFQASRPNRAMGRRLHVRRDLGRLRLRRLRHRCVRPPHHRLAGGALDARGAGPGRAGASDVVALRRQGCRASQRSRQPVPVDSLFRAAGRGRRAAFGGQRAAILTTTRWPRRSSASTRPKSFIAAARGGNLEAVEYATLEWVDWFNNRRLLEPIGNIPPAEHEAHVLSINGSAADGGLTQTRSSPENGAVH